MPSDCDVPARHVLDLDLDFFLERVPRRQAGERRTDRSQPAWQPSQVEWFLRERCSLQHSRGAELVVVDHHHDAFDVVRDRIASHALPPAVHWTHIDAHADLGMSNDGHRYVMTTLMSLPRAARPGAIDRSRLRAGNYLVFLAACGWLASLDYIVHPRRYINDVLAYDDRMPCYFIDQRVESGAMELAAYPPDQMRFADPERFGYGIRLTESLAPEITVPFRTVPAWAFHSTRPCDLVIIARSPDYTPPAVDAFIDVVRGVLSAA
jgi:hypothetical protein